MAAEAARTFREIRARHGDLLSPVLTAFLREGDLVSAEREAAARAQARACRAELPALLGDADVLLTPSAIGEAPLGLEATGDPAFNRIWTLLGTPCLSLPVARGPAGLPVGVQLVARPGADGALLSAAAWIAGALGA
jgi:amidase